MTSSMELPRRSLVLCSPSTHRMASKTLLFPHPLGPTMAVMPGSKLRMVLSANDLNPKISNFLKCIISSSFLGGFLLFTVEPCVNLFFLKPPLPYRFNGRNLPLLKPFIDSPPLHAKISGHLINCHQFLKMQHKIPSLIVLGICEIHQSQLAINKKLIHFITRLFMCQQFYQFFYILIIKSSIFVKTIHLSSIISLYCH